MAEMGTSWSNIVAGGRDSEIAVPILGSTVTAPAALVGRIIRTESPGYVTVTGYVPGGVSRRRL